MIYVPDLENYKCYVVRDEETIRAYKEIPQANSEIEYRDYYYNSNYLYQDGIQNFSTYSTIPICLDNGTLTNEIYYRNDIADILIVFLILSFICLWLPFKLFMRIFKKGRV